MDPLKTILDRFYREYDFKGRIAHDPIEFPRKYKDLRDIEVSGLIASCLAYGRVELFKPVIGRILDVMGKSPCDFVMSFDVAKNKQRFAGIKYRFNETEDIVCLIYMIKKLLLKYSSLEKAFMNFYGPADENIGRGLSGLVAEFLEIDSSPVYGTDRKPAGLKQFLPSPANGSACKRANLFLRWMIRDKDMDFGVWRDVPKDRLVIPLDTHIAKISLCLGLTRRKAQDWKAAVEITEALKKFDPEDPLKYDFALCHHGISGLCKGATDNGCRDCVFSSNPAS